jgi:hypothetical protein
VAWPLARKASWVAHVNAAQREAELLSVRRSIVRGRGSPLGDVLERANGASARPGVNVTSARPTYQTEGKRFLTPFLDPFS